MNLIKMSRTQSFLLSRFSNLKIKANPTMTNHSNLSSLNHATWTWVHDLGQCFVTSIGFRNKNSFVIFHAFNANFESVQITDWFLANGVVHPTSWVKKFCNQFNSSISFKIFSWGSTVTRLYPGVSVLLLIKSCLFLSHLPLFFSIVNLFCSHD